MEEAERERGCYSWLPMAPGRERDRERDGGREGREGWTCGEGRERRRGEDLVRAFLFLLFDLTDCHTQSTPSLSLLPSLAESLCFHGNRLPCLLDNAPSPRTPPQPPHLPPSIANAAIITVLLRHGSLGWRGEDVTWKEETERAEETERKTRGMEGEEERAKREREV